MAHTDKNKVCITVNQGLRKASGRFGGNLGVKHKLRQLAPIFRAYDEPWSACKTSRQIGGCTALHLWRPKKDDGRQAADLRFHFRCKEPTRPNVGAAPKRRKKRDPTANRSRVLMPLTRVSIVSWGGGGTAVNQLKVLSAFSSCWITWLLYTI